MQEVILHIGVHKTGTSSIQNALRDFDDGDTFYARLHYDNHSIAMHTIFSNDYRNYHVWKAQGINGVELDKLREQLVHSLQSQITRQDRKRLIICAEDICILTDGEKKNLIEFITTHGVTPKIVCYVRDPAELSASAFQERVKAGFNEGSLDPYPSFEKLLAPFWRLTNKNNVIVRYFSRENMEENCVVKDFCNVLNMNIENVTDLNESLPSSALKLIFNFNNLPIPISGDRRIAEVRKNMIQALNHAYRDDRKLDANYFLNCVDDSQYEFIEQTCGVKIKQKKGVYKLKSLEDFMLDQSDIDTSNLDNLLDKLDIKTEFFQTIESKMLMLFFGILGRWHH